jgi:diguanylate cyclase (GGDEF)-like protein/PAS domain S-box-containing protein
MNDAPAKATERDKNRQEYLEFSSFADSLNDGLYVTDPDGIFTYVNTALARILGHEKPDDIIGRSFMEFIEPSYKGVMRQRYQAYQHSSVPSSLISVRVLRKDGSTGMIEIRPGIPGHPGFSRGVVRDIKEIRKTEIQLRETETLYQSVVELSPDAIVLSSLEGAILDFNKKALKLFNYDLKEAVLGQWIGSFVETSEQKAMEELLVDAIQKGEQLYSEVTLVRSDDSTFLGEVSAKLLGTINGEKPLLMILARDITDRRATEDQLRMLSVTDPLTKLFNRRGVTLAAEQELRHAKRTGGVMTVMFMDLNGMKRINDTYGHDLGDSVLVSVAQAMRETFRDSDIIGRIGGDEFVVVAVNASIHAAQLMITRLRENLKSCDYPFAVSLACGAVEYGPENDLSFAQLLKLADGEMYKDKRQD